MIVDIYKGEGGWYVWVTKEDQDNINDLITFGIELGKGGLYSSILGEPTSVKRMFTIQSPNPAPLASAVINILS